MERSSSNQKSMRSKAVRPQVCPEATKETMEHMEGTSQIHNLFRRLAPRLKLK